MSHEYTVSKNADGGCRGVLSSDLQKLLWVTSRNTVPTCFHPSICWHNLLTVHVHTATPKTIQHTLTITTSPVPSTTTRLSRHTGFVYSFEGSHTRQRGGRVCVAVRNAIGARAKVTQSVVLRHVTGILLCSTVALCAVGVMIITKNVSSEDRVLLWSVFGSNRK